jgi:hypothetical protein
LCLAVTRQVAPEAFDVLEQLISPLQRKNLAEVAKMLQQVSVNRVFEGEMAYMAPLNDYVTDAGKRMLDFFNKVVAVPDAEEFFQLSGFSDAAKTSKPIIYIAPQEIFNTHALLSEYMDDLTTDAKVCFPLRNSR